MKKSTTSLVRQRRIQTLKKISNESPVGKAALGQAKGAVVEVNVPEGILHYHILNIM